MKTEVSEAIDGLRRAFPQSEVSVVEDGAGGAYVFVECVDLGDRFAPTRTWMGGHITGLYPYADIYPLFIDASVKRADGKAFAPPITAGHNFRGRPAIQISRRNNQIQGRPQTAISKYLKVINFLENLA